ncbi:MAG TPA: T9SS type A sorting domain-containing protein, partial [Bacteroidia bacterium]|nr:T9SS type A sorting domain-containing protein [Bacteroidia bacterium]
GANNTVSVSAVQADNKIIIAGAFSAYDGKSAKGLARLDMNGKFDKSFKVGDGADGVINSIAIQPDEKIIIGGGFSTYKGANANKIARLKKNGKIDNSFSSGNGTDNAISQLVLLPGGKILVAGEFTEYDGHTVRGLARLNNNGSFDNTFEAVITDTISTIYQIAVQPDGKIVVAGFDNSGIEWGQNRFGVIRLNVNGERDYSFALAGRSTGDLHSKVNAIKIEDNGNVLLSTTIYDAGSSVPYHGFLSRLDSVGNLLDLKGFFWINSMQLLENGKILICGFEDVDWYNYQKRVVRLNNDLSVDSSFLFHDDKPYTTPKGVDIQTSAIQIDGKIVLGGNFYEFNSLIANNISRLNADGSFDHTFNLHTGFNGIVLASTEYMNKKLIVGGEFSSYNYQSASNIVRLKENGNIDLSFNTGSGANGKVNAIAIQLNGKILIGGKFTSYNGNACTNLARLNSNGSFDNSFSGAGADGEIRKIVIDNDGRIVIAGDFENVNGEPHRAIARIKPNGTVDNTFSPVIDAYGKGYDCLISSREKIYLAVIYEDNGYTFGTDVYCLNKHGSRDFNFQIATDDFYRINTLSFNNDNKLLIGGLVGYSNLFGDNAGFVAQLNADGGYDEGFNHEDLKNLLSGNVKTINVLNNDRIIIGGEFSANSHTSLNHIALLNSDGTVNTDFTGDAGNSIYSATFVRNDKMVIAGSFSEYAGVVRNGIARISVLESEEQMKDNIILSADKQDMIKLNVYPNPAVSFIAVDNLEPGSTLRIFNAVGEQVFSKVTTNTKSIIELGNYSNGIYFVVAENSGSKSTFKFIVNK